ncbi:hypothetical protein CR513_33851, partial [Mucuna pruriens]
MADALATLSSMLLVNKKQEMTIQVRHQAKMAHCQQLDLDDAKTNGKPWYHDIKGYLEKGAYLLGATKNDKRTLRRLMVEQSSTKEALIRHYYVALTRKKQRGSWRRYTKEPSAPTPTAMP